MRVAAEEYLLINLMMDFLFLFLAARGTWFLNLKRLMAASLFASVYALVHAMKPMPVSLHAFAFAAMSLMAFPVRDKRLCARAVLLSAPGLLVFGSTVRMCMSLGGGTLFSGAIGAFAGCVNLSVMKGVLGKAPDVRSAWFRVRLKGETAEFNAVIDTGNLLKEPLSALPVLIADEEALGKRFVDCAFRKGVFREAAFASVGGDGQMKCVRADEISVGMSGRWVKAPDMWIGLYPGRMRGGVHALAPPVVYRESRIKK